MKKVLEKDNKLCTGCESCFNICPVDAIEMKPDKWGFLYPIIDQDRCIDCKKCKDVCPKYNPNTSNTKHPKCYAAQASDDIRFCSSSGGAFTIFANRVLAENGIVCGAAFDKNFKVKHKCISETNELEDLKKSKYVQSEIGYVFREIEEYAKKGKRVLFVGTPCQTAGLNNYLEKKGCRENVIIVDFLCGGNPSPQMLRDYIDENYDRTDIKHIDFRTKNYGWKESAIIFSVLHNDNHREDHSIEKSAYEKAYHRYMSKRESCIICEFCGYQRQGDLTIGDYWGVEKYDKNLTDGKGTSVIYVNNQKGATFLKSISEDFELFTETPLEASRFNSIVIERRPHPKRDRFFALYPEKTSFTKAVEQSMADYHDVILLGNVAGMNYGSHLTHYALYCALTDKGYTTGVLNVPEDAKIKARNTPDLFSKNPYPSWDWLKRYHSKVDMKELNEKCDVFITGSDQQFASWLYNNDGRFVTQPFVTDNKRKVAYAASLGHDKVSSPEKERATISYYMKKFDAISVREDTAVKLFDDYFGVKTTHVLDPVFLMSSKRYRDLIARSEIETPEKPYLFTYTLDMSDEKEKIISEYAKDRGLYTYAISDVANKEKWSIPTIERPDLETWLKFFANSDFVITDSFHGTCLAIIFHKQFFSIINSHRGSTRFESLFRMLGIENHCVYSEEGIEYLLKNWKSIDYNTVDKILEKQKEKSWEWLTNAIKGDNKKKSLSAYDILDERMDGIDKQIRKEKEAILKDVVDLLTVIMSYDDNKDIKELNKISNIYLYLIALKKCLEDIDIYISVKDTVGFAMCEELNKSFNLIGIKTKLVNRHWCAYVAVIAGGNVLYDNISEKDQSISEVFEDSERKIKISSKPFNVGNQAIIEINGKNWSVNERGINIVVCKHNTTEILDSVCFDTHNSEFKCIRK